MSTDTYRIGIIYSDFYTEQMKIMRTYAKDALRGHTISEYDVSGAFEIPLIGSALLQKGNVDALIALGIIVEGQTHHARQIADATTHGIMDLQMQYQTPFVHEVLYVDSMEQAEQRLHKGKTAAECALNSLAKLASL